ncbi:MAG TPA: adenosylcobinamide-GDP ribazoletransferase [Solirubrobacteraceae bacterium]|nr:adenosylcobinamide-GDP ribazoletransferase [Solirubrobacteraceae bacterium]
MHARADGSGAATPGAGSPTVAAVARRPFRPWSGLAGAITFLTVVPMPSAAVGDAGLGSAAVWFPVVGAAVGALVGGVRVLGGHVLGAGVSSALALTVLVAVTGALHQDGLADTADGIGARGGGRARRLAAMRDSSTGVFGVLALIAWALLLFTTVSALDGDRALRALVVACALGRWAALVHAATTSPARADGLGASLHMGRVALGVATGVALIVALAVGGLVAGAAAVAAGIVVAALSAGFARNTLGGRTGDTLGATVAVVEVAVCVVLLGVWQG